MVQNLAREVTSLLPRQLLNSGARATSLSLLGGVSVRERDERTGGGARYSLRYPACAIRVCYLASIGHHSARRLCPPMRSMPCVRHGPGPGASSTMVPPLRSASTARSREIWHCGQVVLDAREITVNKQLGHSAESWPQCRISCWMYPAHEILHCGQVGCWVHHHE